MTFHCKYCGGPMECSQEAYTQSPYCNTCYTRRRDEFLKTVEPGPPETFGFDEGVAKTKRMSEILRTRSDGSRAAEDATA